MSVVLLEPPREGVALLRLNRPYQVNALNMVVREHLAMHFAGLATDDAVRCVVVFGLAGLDSNRLVSR